MYAMYYSICLSNITEIYLIIHLTYNTTRYVIEIDVIIDLIHIFEINLRIHRIQDTTQYIIAIYLIIDLIHISEIFPIIHLIHATYQCIIEIHLNDTTQYIIYIYIIEIYLIILYISIHYQCISAYIVYMILFIYNYSLVYMELNPFINTSRPIIF